MLPSLLSSSAKLLESAVTSCLFFLTSCSLFTYKNNISASTSAFASSNTTGTSLQRLPSCQTQWTPLGPPSGPLCYTCNYLPLIPYFSLSCSLSRNVSSPTSVSGSSFTTLWLPGFNRSGYPHPPCSFSYHLYPDCQQIYLLHLGLSLKLQTCIPNCRLNISTGLSNSTWQKLITLHHSKPAQMAPEAIHLPMPDPGINLDFSLSSLQLMFTGQNQGAGKADRAGGQLKWTFNNKQKQLCGNGDSGLPRGMWVLTHPPHKGKFRNRGSFKNEWKCGRQAKKRG